MSEQRVIRVQRAKAMARLAQQQIESIQVTLQGLSIPGVTVDSMNWANNAVRGLLDALGVAEDWAKDLAPQTSEERFKDLIDLASSPDFIRDVETAAAAPPPSPPKRRWVRGFKFNIRSFEEEKGKLYVHICEDCGSIVVDQPKHDEHHDLLQRALEVAHRADVTAGMMGRVI
jgi:hypothetical protein